MNFVIYKATNLVNGKSYIGFTSRWPRRKLEHLKCATKNSKFHFHKAIRKYGQDNFEWIILYNSNDLDFCKNIMEGYFIKIFNTIENGYNLTLGGDSINTLPSIRQKISNTMTDRVLSEKHKNALKKPKSKAAKENIKLAKMGVKNPAFGKDPWNKNKKYSLKGILLYQGLIFNSINEAAKFFKIHRNTMQYRIKINGGVFISPS